ncbi:MAG: response regulator [Burkholderiales bacterium]|uniref:response regulator n=1 Tax=Inhella sp. TaxID=1921806 RepID=UPI001ACAF5C3|nr:response regulator [Burkholderiales bacterium]
MLIDATIHKANALVIDANANSRSLITAQLREVGLGFVRAVTRVKDARIVLENAPYDLVICDYHFDGHEESGQDLLDELRRENLLPYSTVFMMITGEATYAKVAEAAEAALDGYLIKPYTLNSLAERIQAARHRKRVLGPIFEAIEAQDFERAAGLCLERFEARAEFWLFAARIGAELLLRLRRHADAKRLYEAIIQAKTVPWAKLGVARSELEAGNLSQARRTLENLIGEMPDHADSHDVLGRVHMEQGDVIAARNTYRTAVELTPGCLLRAQRAGTLSFYCGDREEALRLLERATVNGLKSKLYDAFTLVLIALMRFDKRDGKALKSTQVQLLQMLERFPNSARLQRFATAIGGLLALQDKQTAGALEAARELAAESGRHEADHEVASLVIAIWKRLADQALQIDEMADLMHRIGLRYCINKASTEILVAMAENNEGIAQTLRDCHAKIFEVAETAMKQSLRGQAAAGVQLLMQQGERTRNAKLIDMAMSVLKRHAERVDNAAELESSIAALQERYVKPLGASVARARSAGGMALRGT